MIEWHDTSERDMAYDEYEPCRAVGCKSKERWRVESDKWSDTVCLFHLAAYIAQFRHYDSSDVFELWPVRDLQPVDAHRMSMVGLGGTSTMNGPSGDLTHLLGYIGEGPH